MSAAELVRTVLVTTIGATLVLLLTRDFESRERSVVWFAYAMRVFAVAVQVWVTRTVYDGGDAMFYYASGEYLADGLATNWSFFQPAVLDLLIQVEPDVPLGVEGIGESTGTMSALAAWAIYFVGYSVHAVAAVFAIAAFTGAIALYRVFRDAWPKEQRTAVAIAILLLPSVVYWTSGILKEAVAFAGLGWATWALAALRKDPKRVIAWALAFLGIAAIIYSKGYVLIALMLAGGAATYVSFGVRRGATIGIRPITLLLVAGAVVALLAVVGRFIPRFAVQNLSEEATRLQAVGANVEGGSNYSLGAERGIAGQLLAAPVGLFASLFRPMIFEVRNPQMLLSALETTTLLVVLLRAAARSTLRELVRRVLSSPSLAFCVTFSLVFGTAVGLASTNLGSLARYRVPMMPFIGCFVIAVLRLPKGAQQRTWDRSRAT